MNDSDYDGLGGSGVLLMTSDRDYLSSSQSNISNLEIFLASSSSDIVDLQTLDSELQILGGSGDDILFGGSNNDLINGSSDNDFIDGGAGNDILSGQADNDIIYGGAGDDDIHTGSGDDTVFGGSGRDLITSSNGNNTVVAGQDDDFILIEHDRNGDTAIVTGGDGKDLFGFFSTDANTTITDFEYGDFLGLGFELQGFNPSSSIEPWINITQEAQGTLISIASQGDSNYFYTVFLEEVNADLLSFGLAENAFDGDVRLVDHRGSQTFISNSYGFYINTSPVPEPQTYAMMLAGLALLGLASRKK